MRLLVILLTAFPAFAAGVELQIQYSALQKVLAQQMFADRGRLWVKGNPESKCSYAYLEQPAIGGTEGKLQILAKFFGKNATSFFGRCLGFGDIFDLKVYAVPYYQDGFIRLRDVDVDTGGRETFYARKVRESIRDDLPKKFSYKVSDEAKRILERKPSNEPYQQQLSSFNVSQIRVTPAAIVLTLEFTLVVK